MNSGCAVVQCTTVATSPGVDHIQSGESSGACQAIDSYSYLGN